MKVKFILGEDKRVKILIHSPNNEPFVITRADYELSLFGKKESSGSCEVDGHYIEAKISPKSKGYYALEITFYVADCVRKVRIMVDVV